MVNIDMGYLYYNKVDKNGGGPSTKYEQWENGAPNLQTFLTALNLSNPIVGNQFELRVSRWPRSIFFIKNITIPGISTATLDLNHSGFIIPIATHTKYESTEISFTILADKEGYHYYDWRNMVIQSGHPLVAGDPMSTVGSSGEDTLDIRVRNTTKDDTHHHWIIHNFRATSLGEVELSHDNESFIEFEITGTFTHITYDCGKQMPASPESASPSSDGGGGGGQNGGTGDSKSPSSGGGQTFNPGKTEEDVDSDVKMALDLLKQGMDKDEPLTKDKLMDELREKYPNESEEMLETRAELALDEADEIYNGGSSGEPEEQQKPKSMDLMNGSSEVNSSDDGESQSSSISQIHFEDGNSANEETMQAAQDCNNELDAAKQEYDAKMAEIDNMPADPNYKGDSEWSSEDIESVETPTQEQQEKRREAEEKHFSEMSDEAKQARELADSGKSEDEVKDSLKSKLADKYAGNPEELNKAVDKAYREYDDAKYAAKSETPCDEASIASTQQRTCKSEAQKAAYEKATQEYMAKCKQSLNTYKDKKSQSGK